MALDMQRVSSGCVRSVTLGKHVDSSWINLTSSHTCVCVLCRFSCVWLIAALWIVASRLLCPWDSPGKNTGVGCLSLLQGIFPTRESNPSLLICLLLWQAGSVSLAPPGKYLLLSLLCKTILFIQYRTFLKRKTNTQKEETLYKRFVFPWRTLSYEKSFGINSPNKQTKKINLCSLRWLSWPQICTSDIFGTSLTTPLNSLESFLTHIVGFYGYSICYKYFSCCLSVSFPVESSW